MQDPSKFLEIQRTSEQDHWISATAMTSLNPRSIKSGVLAAAVTVTTIVGALYGAELKTEHEKQQVKFSGHERRPISHPGLFH